MRRIAFLIFIVIALGMAGRSDLAAAAPPHAFGVEAEVEREANRVAGDIIHYSTGVYRIDRLECFQNPHKPWRCLLRAYTNAQGAPDHCDIMLTISREPLTTTKGRFIRWTGRYTTKRAHMLTEGC